VLVTSAMRGDGRTTAALELAYAATAAGETAIVLEFDLRAPALADRLEVEASGSLDQLLEPDARLHQALSKVADRDGLEVGLAPRNPDLGLFEALAPRMPRIVELAAGRADWVIIDAPALGQVVDALPLVRIVDDVVVVARIGHTALPAVHALADLLERAEREATGFVVIGSDPTDALDYYGYSMRAEPEPQDSRSPALRSLRR
jgi:Mrp family chromosome partitioning ATPase